MSPEARERPRAVVAMEKSALRLVAVNRAAAALGLAPGLALADARARHPALEVSEEAPDEAARMLARLADACERYTPLIGLDGTDGLLLDVTGCAHLFGGEEGLVRDLLRRVAAGGFAGRAALAATTGAAFALARFAAGRGGVVAPAAEDLSALLSPLPLDTLRLTAAEVEALARLGFRRVGDLYGKPRAPLAARFGMDLLRRLDAALGHVPTAMDYRFPPPVFCAERNLAEPVERVEDVLGLAAHLAVPLAAALERHGMGARRLDLALFRVDGRVTRLSIGTSRPLRDPQVVRRLFAEKVAALSDLDPGFGFELVRLSVREAAPLAAVQEGLGAADGAGAEALDALVDRLATRFGTTRVQRLVRQDRHVPEEACREVPAQGMRGWAEAAPALEARRQEVQGGLDAPSLDPSAPSGSARLLLRLRPAAKTEKMPEAEPGAGAAAPTMDNARSLAGGRRGKESGQGWIGGACVPVMGGREGPWPGRAPAPLAEDEGAAGGGAAGGASRPARHAASDLAGPARPLRLLERPEPVEAVAEVPDGPPIRFRWRRVSHVVVRAEGPERIAAEWWRSGPEQPTRDYFRVETGCGHRFWLFRAGLYGQEASGPAWFVHGLFG